MKPPLIQAAIQGNSQEVKEILNQGVNPDIPDRHSETALTWAAYLGRTSVVKDLLAAGANREARGNLLKGTPIVLAAKGGHRGIVALLCVLADVNERDERGATPLMLVVEQDAETLKSHSRIIGIVHLLIGAGATLDLQDHHGNTALMWAVRWENKGVVQILLDSGANLGILNDDGMTALSIADSLGDYEIVTLLHQTSAVE